MLLGNCRTVIGSGEFFADVLAPYEPTELHLIDRFKEPSAQYILGTDQLGRDLLSRLIYGARISIFVGLAATTLHVFCRCADRRHGRLLWWETGPGCAEIHRCVESFPGLLLLLTIMSIAGRGLAQIIIVLGVSAGISNSRVVRSAVIGIKENDYLMAARATGSRTSKTLTRHVLPNILAPVIIIFSVTIGGIIISEASLSFLGFGLPHDVPSWGGMLSREGRQHMEIAPRLALCPVFA